MAKVFGFIVALMVTVGSANAALLTAWRFTDGNKDASETVPGVVAAASTGSWSGDNNGYATANFASATTTRTETFFVSTTGSNTLAATDFALKALRATGTRNLTVSVAANLGTGVITDDPVTFTPGSTVNVSLFPAPSTNLSGSYEDFVATFRNAGDTADQAVSVDSSQILRIVVTITAAGSGSTVSGRIDDITLNGAAVPEPASIAIFGLMGAGVAIRRLRRKA